ncbi:hypothetical protein [Helicobacter sp. 23-1045]
MQPFLRKEINESKNQNGESVADSANETKNAESNAKITHPLNPPRAFGRGRIC